MMKSPSLFSYALLLSVIYSASCGAISQRKDGVEEHVEASTPLEASGKSGEVEVGEKTADSEDSSSETRVERSSEANLDKSDDYVESKTDPEAETTFKMASEDDDKSAEVDDKMADIDDAAEEISSERSITGLDDAGIEKNSFISSRTLDKDAQEVEEQSADDQIRTSVETRNSMPYDTREILDSKARMAENSEENLEIQAKSDLEALNAEAFGSRRSYSGSPSSPSFVNSGRSGLMFDDLPLPIPNPNPVMFTRISQELVQPNDYFKSPLPPSSELKAHNGLDSYFDPLFSSELKPLEQLNSNPSANSYPYAFQPTTTHSPADINLFQNVGILSKFGQPLENLNRPVVGFFGQNVKPLPIPFKPLEQNVPFPVFRPLDVRFNQLSNQPPRYYKKCSYCGGIP